MSVVHVGGRAYAAGLYWLERGGAGATARTARRLGRPWCVHHGERTGFAADDPAETLVPGTLVPGTLGPQTLVPENPGGLDPEGLPALALALLASIEGAFWMALVEGDADPSGGRRYALVKARGGSVLADGDEVFEDRAAALAAFARARPLGWSLFATPGLHDELGGAGTDPRAGDVAALDPAALDEAAAAAGGSIALVRAASRRRWLRPAAAVSAVAALAAIAVLWFERDALIAWLAGPEMAAVAPAVRPAPQVAVAVDAAALIAACREALIAHPPFLPAWRIERVECAARFADPELAGLVPELAGGPALLVRWRLEDGHAEAVQRRVAERHLARWHAAAVAGARAWAAAALGPVLRVVDEPVPAFVELRREVDRAFGTGGARVGYPRAEVRYLPESAAADVPKIVAGLRAGRAYADIPMPSPPAIRKGRNGAFHDKGLEGASHHAIVPNVNRIGDLREVWPRLTADEKKLFDAIARSYLASIMPDYRYRQTTATLDVRGFEFRATGRQPIEAGWRGAFPDWKPDEEKGEAAQALPPLRDGETARLRDPEIESKETRPPPRYREGTLIEAMQNAWRFVEDEALRERLREAKGIGTPATRAEIISGLKKQGFLVAQGKNIVPTDRGLALFGVLKRADGRPIRGGWLVRAARLGSRGIPRARMAVVLQRAAPGIGRTRAFGPTRKPHGKR